MRSSTYALFFGVRDELSVYFENPATDAMGYDHVEGRLFCGREYVELQFKQKDRAFRKSDAVTIRLDYNEVGEIEYRSSWFKPKVLIFQSRIPEKLEEFPGADVGRVQLLVNKESRDEARKAAAFIEYRQSEAYLRESDKRMSESRDEFGSEI